MPNSDRPQIIHYTEKERHEQKRDLGNDKDDLAVGAIDDGAAEGGKKHAR